MNKEQLLKLAEAGVKQRLQEIQIELNNLARLFPHLVMNQDGSMPAVAPVNLKKDRTAVNQRISAGRKAYWARCTPEARERMLNKMRRAKARKRKAREKGTAT